MDKMSHTTNETKTTFKTLEQRYKLLRQQQVIFITALARCRENANDKIGPVRNLQQVRSYLDNHCYHSTDKRILSHFLDTCTELAKFCVQLEALQCETGSSRGLVEETITLLGPTNKLSALRAKYPHDVVNHLSCDEAKNFYGGVVSLLPIALDNIREALYRMERIPPPQCDILNRAGQRDRKPSTVNLCYCSDKQTTGVQSKVSLGFSSLQINDMDSYVDSSKPAWRPPGKSYNA
ncbi:sperm acrosome-associated protein 9-like isoform X2 [Mixophyes fleayi]|uniref:sperm acrosome-associated protein 9-like isoform X2 n=1 Tax=Mixophyes fleayi TaxID=3061075 RepID=UPI003F4DEE56